MPFALFAVNCEVITYNAALKKTAYQSSVFIGTDGEHGPEFANDGRRQARCAKSNVSDNPWWAVDLGRPTKVYRVDLTNVNDDKTGTNQRLRRECRKEHENSR